MNMRIVVAPNAFKGSMSAVKAAEAMKKGILAVMPRCDVACVPVADGGDGLTEDAGRDGGFRPENATPVRSVLHGIPTESGCGGNGQSQRAGPVAQGIA